MTDERQVGLRKLVDEQAEDEGLWFIAHTAPEAYLQQELRRLHAAIERGGDDGLRTAARKALALFDHEVPYVGGERQKAFDGVAGELRTALAVAQVPAQPDCKALLREFDGSVCPACHHRAHEPGSCSECPRCELHTDEALAFVLRYEPDLLALPAQEERLDVERLARALFEADRPGDWPTWTDYVGAFGSPGIAPWRRKAERIAAEYRALEVEPQDEREPRA